jgi:hypothetical protein
MILLAICLLSGCSALSGPDVERSTIECLAHGGSPSWVVTSGTKSFKCQR